MGQVTSKNLLLQTMLDKIFCKKETKKSSKIEQDRKILTSLVVTAFS